jgi:two-component system sensor histidine kinase YesM
VFTIEDDGVGVNEAKLSDIRRKLEGPPQAIDGHGLGLINVQRRVRYYFGADFGVFIESTEGRGTRVSLSLPVEPTPAAKEVTIP